MPADTTPLLREVALALVKITVMVIALVLVYPYVVTAIADSLNLAHLPQ